MSKVKLTPSGRLILPADFLKRRHLVPPVEYWLDEREGDLILQPCFPNIQKIYIEATTGCNLYCRTCVRNIWEDQEGKMTMATFRHLARGLAQLPQLKWVNFAGFGEPLTHPHLLDMIETVRQRDLAVSISTNGLLLDEPLCRELVRLGVERVVVSIDGVNPDTYQDIRGAMLAQVLANIHRLHEAKHQLGAVKPLVGLEFVALKSNLAELADLAGLAASLNAARVLVSHVLPYTADMRAEVLYGYAPRPPLPPSSWPVKVDGWIMWGTMDLPRMHWGAERRCKFVQDQAVLVGWDGGVLPCLALSHNYTYFAIDGQQKRVSRYVLGNVRDQSLADIWTSAEYVRFRSAVRAFHFPSCPDCDLRETCDLRENNEGCWGLNPSCADCLWAQDIIRCP